MSIINQILNQSKTSSFPEPMIDELGWKYYPELPEGMRLATMQDVQQGHFKKGTSFLLYAAHANKYECHRLKGELTERLKGFIEAERVWIIA